MFSIKTYSLVFQRKYTHRNVTRVMVLMYSFILLSLPLFFPHRPPYKLAGGGRSRPPSGSVSQRSTSGSHGKSSLSQLHSTVSPMVRGKLAERASRIRARRPSALETSDDSDDDTSSDSTDD